MKLLILILDNSGLKKLITRRITKLRLKISKIVDIKANIEILTNFPLFSNKINALRISDKKLFMDEFFFSLYIEII